MIYLSYNQIKNLTPNYLKKNLILITDGNYLAKIHVLKLKTKECYAIDILWTRNDNTYPESSIIFEDLNEIFNLQRNENIDVLKFDTMDEYILFLVKQICSFKLYKINEI